MAFVAEAPRHLGASIVSWIWLTTYVRSIVYVTFKILVDTLEGSRGYWIGLVTLSCHVWPAASETSSSWSSFIWIIPWVHYIMIISFSHWLHYVVTSVLIIVSRGLISRCCVTIVIVDSTQSRLFVVYVIRLISVVISIIML
jgi:hypothetical protein